VKPKRELTTTASNANAEFTHLYSTQLSTKVLHVVPTGNCPSVSPYIFEVVLYDYIVLGRMQELGSRELKVSISSLLGGRWNSFTASGTYY